MRSFTLNDMNMLATSSETDSFEPQLRLSRFGVAGGLTTGAVALAVSAPGVRPMVFPDDPEVVVSFGAWWMAAGLTLWLALSLAAWMLVLGRPTRRPSAWVCRITVPGSRQLAEAMLAVSVIAVPAACSAGAPQVAPRIEVLSSGVDGELGEVLASSTVSPPASSGDTLDDAAGFSAGVGTLTDPPPVTLLADSTAPVTGSATLDVEAGSSLAPGLVDGSQDDGLPDDDFQDPETVLIEPSAAAPTGTAHVVVKGDNFWAIADAHLTLVSGNSPTNSQIATYWRRLVDVNRTRITSGNPDLIFPGEELVLPSVLTE